MGCGYRSSLAGSDSDSAIFAPSAARRCRRLAGSTERDDPDDAVMSPMMPRMMTPMTTRKMTTWRGPWILAILLILSVAPGLAPRDVAAPATPQPRLKILVVHGPNLNLLGRREPQIYGTTTLEQIDGRLQDLAKEINVELVTVQSNHEGAIVDAFHKHMDDVNGGLINAAGLTFSSVSIHDAIKAMPFPVIEVHISNLATRDEIHRNSILTPAARGAVMGLGWRSYTAALRALVEIVRESGADKAAKPPKE
jgi:3-dehydroquinate dehydratase-2